GRWRSGVVPAHHTHVPETRRRVAHRRLALLGHTWRGAVPAGAGGHRALYRCGGDFPLPPHAASGNHSGDAAASPPFPGLALFDAWRCADRLARNGQFQPAIGIATGAGSIGTIIETD